MEEMTLIVATADVGMTKMLTYGPHLVEVRATDKPGGGLSIHYEAEAGEVPTVGEKLLVAVLAGVYSEWLNEQSSAHPITFRAVSAAPRVAPNVAPGDEGRTFDTLAITETQVEAGTRLYVSMLDESGHVVHAAVELSKGQVTSMLTALLAIYRRLEEA